MLIGYMRPMQNDPDCEKQRNILTELNCDKIFMEEHSSAKKRCKLDEMVNTLHPGDKIVVYKLIVFADSTRHLLELLNIIDSKGSSFHSLKEEIDTSHDADQHFKHTIKHIVEFQSDLISEKTKKGLYEAKQKGIVTGRPRKHDENVKRAIAMYQSKKYTLAEIKEETGISKSTLYRYLEK